VRISTRLAFVLTLAFLIVPGMLAVKARGSDFFATPSIASKPGVDINDLYVFPSPTNANNVVLVMDLHPLIPSGQGPSVVFDPNLLFQFKIDNTGDLVEDLVIQAKFTGTGSNQQVQIAGPIKPSRTGTQSVFEKPDSVMGTINVPFTLSNGVKVFAGAREDPSFFDVNQFWSLLPDRANPQGPTFTNTSGTQVSTTPANPNQLMGNSWRSAGAAIDFFKGLNVLSIVIELPRSMLKGAGTGKINVWCTTSA
jgi:hypothetical protein